MNLVIGILSIALMFLLLIAPHEAGHFAFAKLFKVRVIEFSIGMGSRLLSRTWGGTLYAFRLLPVAGYVRMGGMEPDDLEGPDGFHGKPAYQRLLILFGGPLVNFVVASVIATAIFLIAMNPYPGKVAAVVPNTPAATAGVRAGDVIQRVNGQEVTKNDTIRSIEAKDPSGALRLDVARADGSRYSTTITPAFNEKYQAYLIGIQSQGVMTSLGGRPILSAGDAIVSGLEFPVQALGVIGEGLYMLASGQIPGGVFGPQGATGPIGIGAITYHAANEGLLSWLYVAALLSVALGSANLLPLPALDGGRIVVVLLEKLRGRPFNRERELSVQKYGLVALLALMAVIAFFDVQRLLGGQFPGLK